MASRYSSDHEPQDPGRRRAWVGWWRLAMSLIVAVLVCSIGALIVTNLQLGKELRTANNRLSSLTTTVNKSSTSTATRIETLKDEIKLAQEQSLKENDLDLLRNELEKTIGTTSSRVTALEVDQKSLQTVVQQTSQSVLFLQGSYQLVDGETNRPLRYARMDENGEPEMLLPGIPLLHVDGEGPVYEPIFTGTGFVVSTDGLIMTNRHVAMPWEPDRLATVLIERGVRPEITRMWGFLPGIDEPFDVSLVKASENADLALLRCSGVTSSVPALRISQTDITPGTEVIVMGYPTGMRALLARAGEAYAESRRGTGIDDYWKLAEQLSRDGMVNPLASRGIVGQKSLAHIVYDAETTSGGSGGPVLTRDGQVVAVNTAILPDFDGSNLGVPANQILELIQANRDSK